MEKLRKDAAECILIRDRAPDPTKREIFDIATVTASFITGSGRSAWFIGALLIFIYAVFALTLYVVPPTAQGMG